MTFPVTTTQLAFLEVLAEIWEKDVSFVTSHLIRDGLYYTALSLAQDANMAREQPRLHELARQLVLYGPTPKGGT